jgi:acyl-CoA synthetase (AMP-forming)/AMP-acid ligase II
MSDRGSSLRDALLSRAQSDADALAFAAAGETLSFGELAERADARAGTLQASVRPGDTVALAMPAGLALVEAFWAAQLLGAVPCVLNPHVPEPTLAQRLRQIDPAVVIDAADDKAHTPGHGIRSTIEIVPDDVAVLQFTSGTTGDPRASMILQRNFRACLEGSERVGYVRPDDVCVSWVPPWHDLGLVRFVIGPVFHGVPCHIIAPAVRTIPEWLQTISAVGGTLSGAPDFAYRAACRMVDPGRVDLSSLRVATSGGEPVRMSTITAFEERFGIPGRLRPGYGLGEATLGVCTTLPGEEIVVDARGNVACGHAVPGVEVRAGSAPNAPEEIRVRGATVFAGYHAAPQDTAAALRDGWLHTGDSGYLDGDGRLFVLGRRHALIKRAGSVVAPRELEEAAQQVEGVRLAGAVSVAARHDADAEIVVAVEAGALDATAKQALVAAVSRGIAAAVGFAPHRVVVLGAREIPRTENGKVRHSALAARLAAG